MKAFKKLEKGDTIAFVAPSSAVLPERIAASAAVFEQLGFRVQIKKSCFLRHGYFAGSDEVRANDLNEAFYDKEISGIFAMRGGYGAQRLMHLLDWNIITENPKFFAGYSDCTALHIAFNRICDYYHTYHMPMPSTELYKPIDEYTMSYVKKCVFCNPDEPFGELINPLHVPKTLVSGTCSGTTTGGNLSLIVSSIGTPYEIDTNGSIIFIEEVDEPPYKIDRMLLQLKNAGKFDSCSGIVFGSFSGCNTYDASKSLSIADIMDELIVPMKKPCLTNVAFGHTLPTLSFPLGKHAFMDADKKLIRIE